MAICLLLLVTMSDFKETELTWRSERETRMRADDSWLNLVGLFWLKEGPNNFGTSSDGELVFPKHATVNHAGTLFLEDGHVRFAMNRGQGATIDGEFHREGELKKGQVLAHNHLRMFIIERGGRLAIRARDLRARAFVKFESLDFYRPKQKFEVEAQYEPFDEPKTVTIFTVIDTELELTVPGALKFELDGKQLELWPTLETAEDESWFIMFKDQTSGTETYSGGRFLYVDPPVDGKVTLNFNRAINPPCAYTAYATCPLPPAENWLPVPIESGERIYTNGAHHGED